MNNPTTLQISANLAFPGICMISIPVCSVCVRAWCGCVCDRKTEWRAIEKQHKKGRKRLCFSVLASNKEVRCAAGLRAVSAFFSVEINTLRQNEERG